MPGDNEFCTCWFVISLDSVVKVDTDYYPQILLK